MIIAATVTNLDNMDVFLKDFDEKLGFSQYLKDPVSLDSGTTVVKVAGQMCYHSFGKRRRPNSQANEYIHNILESGHGSVLEHASVTFSFYGISRATTHELVRHRHFSYSQTSQRYVGPDSVRYVERRTFQMDNELHRQFETAIDQNVQKYRKWVDLLYAKQTSGMPSLQGDKRTEMRIRVQQDARDVLINAVEAPIVVSGNVRSWRHFLDMRASKEADTPIRLLAMKVYRCLDKLYPGLFWDYRVVSLQDGTEALQTAFRNV